MPDRVKTVWLYEPLKHNPNKPRPRCSKCDAEIVWALTEKGAKMPLDAGHTFAGLNVRLTACGKLYEVPNDFTHWATCIYAKSFHERGKAVAR